MTDDLTINAFGVVVLLVGLQVLLLQMLKIVNC